MTIPMMTAVRPTDVRVLHERFYVGVSPAGVEPHGGSRSVFEHVDDVQMDVCCMWLELFATRTKTVRTRASSYTLKHYVESWCRDEGRPMYISNGAFIVAAARSGYEARRAAYGSPNLLFRMAINAWRKR